MEFCCDSAEVRVYSTTQELGQAAAAKAAQVINRAVDQSGRARVIVATGNSQLALVDALVTQDVPWQSVEIFHMDEYAGMHADHPASFRRWIKARVEDKVHPGQMNYLEGDAADLKTENRSIHTPAERCAYRSCVRRIWRKRAHCV